MLSYLILTTRALLMGAVIWGAAYGYTGKSANRTEKWAVWIPALLGTIVSVIVAVMRNTTNLVDTAILNGWIYAISLTAFVMFLIFTLTPLGRVRKGPVYVIRYLLVGILMATVIAYAMPDVWAYPHHVLMSEKTVISTDFLLAMIGMTAGLILTVVTYFAVSKTVMRLSDRGAYLVLVLLLLMNAALRLSGLFSVFFQKKIIKQNHTMFVYTVFVKNNSDWFIFLSLFIVIIAAAVLWVRSFTQKEPYRNPAEHRKIRAKWRSIRRWGATVMICGILGVINLTLFEKLNAVDVTLSPIEDATSVDDENIYVGFDLVEDGHLHRFAYTTDAGTVIRFIVIKKPNSKSYGIGLDACDVCGETGYYEKDGQVVCNLCDVVMNISTIGFKGGCNPIVIPYEIKNGQIIVPISGLLEYESEFK